MALLGFSSGNLVHFIDLESKAQSTLPSVRGSGIGAIAVHPQLGHLCVAEKGTQPEVFIYEYPSLKLCRVMRNGTERAYSAAAFTKEGDLLATVGSFPDYMLTVWDWKREAIVLRAKAFSQEVYGVSFSPFVEGKLVTSGTSHVRFWSMATTFTGLKLKGDLGKFGMGMKLAPEASARARAHE